jgi:hypothetical protein
MHWSKILLITGSTSAVVWMSSYLTLIVLHALKDRYIERPDTPDAYKPFGGGDTE